MEDRQETAEPLQDVKGARRAASLCAFTTVAEITIAYTLIFVASVLIRNVGIGERMYDNLLMLVNTVAVDLIAMPLCWLLLLRRVPKAAAPETGSRTRLSFSKLLFYLPCAFCLMYAGGLAGKLIGKLFDNGLSDVIGETMRGVDLWVEVLCTVIIGPAAEELFFRKAMIDRLSGYHPLDAILLSALLFALMHGNIAQFLYALPLGVLFGIIYYRTRNIGYTILLHTVLNVFGGLVPQLLYGSDNRISLLAAAAFGLFILAMCITGVILLIVYRRRFLPIASDRPRCRKPFFLNAGFIVACAVFAALFVLNEIIA